MKQRAAAFALGAIACAWALAAAAAAEFTIPPTPDHYVTDNAGALSSGTRSALENELQRYESATGHQIVVWIDETTGDVPLETWTGETADQWKIGRRGDDDGAVLFVFMKDHKARIEVGYGLESALTDADSSRIISDVIRPRMRASDPDGAVSEGVAAMLTTITPSYKGVSAPAAPASGGGIPFFNPFFGFLAFLALKWFLRLIRLIMFGDLVTRDGSRRGGAGLWGGGGFGGGFGGGGGFSAGGGGFGGGGASGGW